MSTLHSILDPKWLFFMKVSELGSLTRAAAAFDVPQSMISRHISQLEQQCGTRLFRRTGRGVVLTDFGQQIMPRIQALVANAEDIADEIRTTGGIPVGDVRVGMLPSTVPMAASRLFALVQARFPRVRLHLSEGANTQLEEQLREGRIDMALLLREGQKLTDGSETVLSRLCLCIVGQSNAPLVAQPTVTLADLQDVPLVVPSHPHPLRARLDQLARAQGLKLNVAVEADSIRLQHEVAAAGAGYAISSGLLGHDDQRLACARIVKPELTRNIVLATTPRRPHTLATRKVHQLIQQIVPDLLR